MADESVIEKIHDLSDLELAALLCLIAKEHCLISTPNDALDTLTEELRLVARKVFGLNCVVVECTPSTTLDDFASALLLPHDRTPSPRQAFESSSGYFGRSSLSRTAASPAVSLRIANLVIAKNLDLAPQVVQIQALELLRTKRIYTRTAVQVAPKQFLFVPVIAAENGGQARVTKHLNDAFFVAHWHDPDDGFVNLEETEGDDVASLSSVIKGGISGDISEEPFISEAEISHLSKLASEVQVDIEVTRYQMNIVSFLRMHRAVADGITPTATKHLGHLMRCLAPLHKSNFVTPALVDLATRKVYLHRIRITEPEKERSMQWGSKLHAVQAVLKDIGPEEVIDDVLGMVTAPL